MNYEQRYTATELQQLANNSPTPTVNALLQTGLAHHQSGRLAEAEDCYRRLLTENPNHADALHLLGLIAYQAKRYDAAVDLISQAIDINGQNATYFFNLGVILNDQGKHEGALSCYDKAISFKHDYAEAYNNRGSVLKALNRFDEALDSYGQALALSPDYAAAHNNRAAVLIDLKKYEEALISCDRALVLNPGFAAAFNNRANALYKLRRHNEAIDNCNQALALNPRFLEALNNRGNALRGLGRFEEALTCYDESLLLNPNYLEALNNRASVLGKLQRHQEALASCDQALELNPNFPKALNTRSILLRELERYDEALACCGRLLLLEPDNVIGLTNYGLVLSALERFDEALAYFEKAATIDPSYASAHWNESLIRLLLGDYERGWAKHEWRWKCETIDLRVREFIQPLWLGDESIKDKKILIHNEQGLGDAIQFCRYLPLLQAQGAHVILEIQEPLRQLLSSLGGVAQCISRGEKLPDFDYHCSINSLPSAFKTRLETIPSHIPYIEAPAQAVAEWKTRLGYKDRPCIGLVWSGNPKHENDRNRSVSLSALLPLLDFEATFVSLQKDVRPVDEAVLNERSDILNLDPSLKDFTDTVALISCLDLVISVDTSVAHLAGALGKPVWILLPYIPDWRWLLDREDSPWYPTARLFRQIEHRQWAPVIERLRQALEEFLDSGR